MLKLELSKLNGSNGFCLCCASVSSERVGHSGFCGMSINIQQKLDFNNSEIHPVNAPSGYRGLSGFHKYWGKKPTEAWHFLIENLTTPDDIVLDPFLGSGLIAKECADLQRLFIGFDINPISIELTKLYLELPSYTELRNAINEIKSKVKNIFDIKYMLSDGSVITHLLWEKDTITKLWTKHRQKRVELPLTQEVIDKFQNAPLYEPKTTRDIHLFDNSRINSKQSFSLKDLFTPRALYTIDILKEEIEQYRDPLRRALLLILSASLGQMSKMVFVISKRGKTKKQEIDNIEVGSWVIGYWKPVRHFEINAWNCFYSKAGKLQRIIKEINELKETPFAENITDVLNSNGRVHVCVGDSETLLEGVPSNSVKAILTDPPHGDRIPYLELSEMWNSVIGLNSNYADELVISDAKGRNKDTNTYNEKLMAIAIECARVLKDDGVMAVMFNSKSKDHWATFRMLEKSSVLMYIGCYATKYSACSVVQTNRKGGLKADFILLYAKKSPRNQKETIIDKFKIIDGWSLEFPKV